MASGFPKPLKGSTCGLDLSPDGKVPVETILDLAAKTSMPLQRSWLEKSLSPSQLRNYRLKPSERIGMVLLERIGK